MATKIKKRVFSVVIVLVVLFVIELGFQAWGLFYNPNTGINSDGTNIDEYLKIPHPYLGFIDPSFKPVTKSQIPQPRNEYFVLTIAGASVAQAFCTKSRDQTHFLEQAIGKIVNKKVILNCLGIGSYTQPQQLIASLLYAKESDFYISIEGYNELFDPKELDQPDYPISRFSHIFYSNFREQFWMRNTIYFLAAIEIWANKKHPLLDSSKTIQFFKKGFRESIPAYLNRFENHGDDVSQEIRRQIWQENLEKLKIFLDGAKIPFFVIFQPLLEAKKNLTPMDQGIIDKRKVNGVKREKFIGGQTLVQQMITQKYPLIDYNENSDLIERKLEFTDECHFTEAGYHELMNQIITDFQARWRGVH